MHHNKGGSMSDMSKALEPFGPSELEAPSHQARELAETRDYEARTRISTIFSAGEDSINGIVAMRRKINSFGELPAPTRNHVNALEARAFEAASSTIQHLGEYR